METAKLTVRLRTDELTFLKAFAQEHGMTVTEVIHRYLQRMRELAGHEPSPKLAAISGIVPSDVDAEGEYRLHQLGRQR